MTWRQWLQTSAVTLLAATGLTALGLPSAAQAADHMGGTLKLISSSAAGTIDPQINYTAQDWQIFYITNDGLVEFKKDEGPGSNDVVADLATAIPKPEDGGKTYVFTLRRGIKFSTGAEITPDDVVASFQRLFKVNNPNAGSWYNWIVGADLCLHACRWCRRGRQGEHDHLPSDAARLRVLLQARNTLREHSPGQHAAQGPRHHGLGGDRPLYDNQ
jgi:peptide/nickel transport system substrate-binding protein